jgi:methanogenic corrinoid protein MtbC1
MSDSYFSRYFDAVFETDREKAKAIIEEALEQGMLAEDAVFTLVVPGIERMLSAFIEKREATLSQHFVAARIADEMVDFLSPRFSRSVGQARVVVVGTPPGDFHGLGKKILSGLLRARMFEVVDLGLSVEPERFVDEATARGAKVIAVSSMMLHTAIGERGPKAVRALLDARSLSGEVRLIVGGAPYKFDDGLYREVGADAWSPTALGGVALVREAYGELG